MMQPKADGVWVSSAEYARREKIRPETASRRLAKRYRRGDPRVRQDNGQGGSRGMVYKVLIEHVPLEPGDIPSLKREMGPEAGTMPVPVAARPSRRQLKRRAGAADAEQAVAILNTIAPALKHPKGSRERAEAIRHIAVATGLSRPTIRRAIRQYEDNKLAGLVRARRPEAGKRVVLISRAWDKSVSLRGALKRAVVRRFRRYIRSQWASDAPSAPHVARMAERKLFEFTREALDEAGVTFSDAELRRACRGCGGAVERERHYSIVAIKDRDAKRYHDKILPRVRRSREGLRPMDCVVCDIHHCDCLVARADGQMATPKMICWYDLATNRVFITLVLLDKGKGVTQRMVARSFADMVRDSSWGLPRSLYLDNGAELKQWPNLIAGLMKLAQRADMYFGDLDVEPQVHAWTRGVRGTILRTRPYSSPGRGSIEGFFGLLERGPGAMLPGAIPGNRMIHKTKNQGEQPTPHPGGFVAFEANFRDVVLPYYHATPQSGFLGGRCPDEVFAKFVAEGWESITVPDEVLTETLAVEEIRVVAKCAVSLGAKVLGVPDGGGARQYFNAVLAARNGERVSVRVPLICEPPAEHVAIYDLKPVDPDVPSQFLCHAALQPEYDYFDSSGAREQSRMASEVNAEVRGLKSETNELDQVEEMRAWASSQPGAPAPGTAVVLAVPEALAEAATVRSQLPEPDREDPSLVRRRRLSLLGDDPPKTAEEVEMDRREVEASVEEMERQHAARRRAEEDENERLRQWGKKYVAQLERKGQAR